ncbi:RHS repeat protein, partial [Serratia fonticola]|uniref:RHS repeat domain-containing protein n=1 Tax=Serratia fonticola TaxID=47917 RepID=UPI002096A308
YDCRHRLVRHETPDGSVSTYTYDAFNRRLRKTANGKLLEFVWRDNQLVAETDGKDYWQSYLYEPGSYRPMALWWVNLHGIRRIKPRQSTGIRTTNSARLTN